MAGGFGGDSYGGDAFGDGSSSIELASAFALDTNTVRVTLTAPALAESGFAVGDAMNPGTWALTRLDTNVSLTVLAVRAVASDTFDVRVLEPLADSLTSHRLQSTTLLSTTGVLIGPTNSVTFVGVLDADFSRPVAATTSRRYPSKDIANPPFPSGSTTIAGGFVINSSGDVAMEEGAPLVRKLILRRLTTARGAFFHLPNYGVGLALKEPVQGTGDMMRFKKRIEQELLQEPEIAKVSVGLEQRPAEGIMIVRVAATLKNTGQVLNVESVTQR